MSMHRRQFIQSGTAASFLTALGWPALAADAPTVGLIFPPANYPIPPDAGRLYPSGVRFIGNGLGFNGMTIESYNEAIPRAMPRAQELAAQGANLISVFGSSITFYKGAAFNEELTKQVTALTGLPATTQSNGLINGLKHVNAKRVAVATAYTDIVTDRLEVFLIEHGFQVMSKKGLGYERVPEGAATTTMLVLCLVLGGATLRAQHVEPAKAAPIVSKSPLEKQLHDEIICTCGTCGRKRVGECT